MPQSLRILQLNNRIPWPLNDGGNIATWNVTHQLHRLGHEVTFAALNTSKHHQDPKVMAPICDIHTVDIDTRLTPLGLMLGLVQRMPYNVKRFASDEFAEMLARVASHQEFDVIQLEGSYMGLYVEVLRKASRAPIVLRTHNVEHQIWQRMAQGERNPVKRAYLSQLARKIRDFELDVMRKVDALVAITEDDERWYVSQGFKGRHITLPAGVDGQRFAPPSEEARPGTVAFLGSLEWLPNVEGLTWLVREVWPQVLRHAPHAHLHVAGKNPSEAVRRLTAAQMTFHGEVPDAPAFLGQSGVLAVPLHSGGGMRLKVVEAMAAGRCVVSTTVGAEGIRCTPGEDILIADGAEAFSQALALACKDAQLARRVGEKARQTALAHYGWEPLVRRLVDFHSEILRRQ